jgi:dolichol-phosphate mannosyltransferase
MITGMPVKDPTAGFMCYKNKVLAAMQLDHISSIGYAFQIEMKFASWRLGFKLKEVPITFIDRKIGVSKMSKGIIKEAVLGVLSMQWESFTGRFIKQIKREQL